jgi:hypothetical protein
MSPLARKLAEALRRESKQFAQLVDSHMDVPWREFLRAWGELRAADILERDEDGNYLIGGGNEQSGT